MQYFVTREKGTELAFDNEFWDDKRKGTYKCVCCGETLFDSKTKFASGTGWPSFYKPIAQSSLDLDIDLEFDIPRVEVKCSRCGAHLGHVFDDGPKPTGLRYCLNSAALKFEETKKQASKVNSNGGK